MDVCPLEISSGTLSIGDPIFFPGDQIVAEVQPGIYVVEAMGVDYGIERRIARLRILAPTKEYEVQHAGEISVDSGSVAVCDLKVFTQALREIETDLPAVQIRYLDKLALTRRYGVIDLEADFPARMAWVQSGWGDGRYPVYKLLYRDQIVGVEAVFIDDDEGYAFEGAELYDIV